METKMLATRCPDCGEYGTLEASSLGVMCTDDDCDYVKVYD